MAKGRIIKGQKIGEESDESALSASLVPYLLKQPPAVQKESNNVLDTKSIQGILKTQFSEDNKFKKYLKEYHKQHLDKLDTLIELSKGSLEVAEDSNPNSTKNQNKEKEKTQSFTKDLSSSISREVKGLYDEVKRGFLDSFVPKLFQPLFNNWKGLLVLLGGLVTAINWKKIVEVFTNFSKYKEDFLGLVKDFGTMGLTFKVKMANILGKGIGSIKSLVTGARNLFKTLVAPFNVVGKALKGIWSTLTGIVKGLGKAIDFLKHPIKNTKELAEVTSKTVKRKALKTVASAKRAVKNLLPKKEVEKTVAKEAEKAVGKTIAKEATKEVAKGAGKVASKKIPLLGAGVSAGLAYSRAKQGDWTGAGMEALSGVLAQVGEVSTATGVGASWGVPMMAASYGVDAAIIARDISKAHEANQKAQAKAGKVQEEGTNATKNLTSAIEKLNDNLEENKSGLGFGGDLVSNLGSLGSTPHGRCLGTVENAYVKTYGENLGRHPSAWQAASNLSRSKFFKETKVANLSSLKKLPRGSIVVWGKGTTKHGHISVADGNGNELSDYKGAQRISISRRDGLNYGYPRVFLPSGSTIPTGVETPDIEIASANVSIPETLSTSDSLDTMDSMSTISSLLTGTASDNNFGTQFNQISNIFNSFGTKLMSDIQQELGTVKEVLPEIATGLKNEINAMPSPITPDILNQLQEALQQ